MSYIPNCTLIGLVTIKYIYGPASVVASSDGVVGSSISGRIEASVTLSRLTTINMPMKGITALIHVYIYIYIFKCLFV